MTDSPRPLHLPKHLCFKNSSTVGDIDTSPMSQCATDHSIPEGVGSAVGSSIRNERSTTYLLQRLSVAVERGTSASASVLGIAIDNWSAVSSRLSLAVTPLTIELE